MAGAGSEGFSIHPAEIEGQAPVFSTESGTLAAALSRLQGSLDTLGAAWGDDDQGKKFAAAYQPNEKSLLKMLHTLVQGLQSIHDGLSAHAANHAGADAHAASSMQGG